MTRAGTLRMYHHVARALSGALLFRTHGEAAALWERITSAVPELVALCLMPDHIHLILPHDDADGRLHAALSGYARWRNHRRGTHGPVFARRPRPVRIPDAAHLRRTIRYVHLNPCRKGLVDDPLAWPWSTHRDYVGYAFPSVVPRDRSPVRFHHYVSADPSAQVLGTELPTLIPGDFGLDAVVAATSSVCRALPDAMEMRTPARTLAIEGAWLRGHRRYPVLTRRFACGRTTIWEAVHALEPGLVKGKAPDLSACIRVVGDARFGALHEGDLRPSWPPYRRHV